MDEINTELSIIFMREFGNFCLCARVCVCELETRFLAMVSGREIFVKIVRFVQRMKLLISLTPFCPFLPLTCRTHVGAFGRVPPSTSTRKKAPNVRARSAGQDGEKL